MKHLILTLGLLLCFTFPTNIYSQNKSKQQTKKERVKTKKDRKTPIKRTIKTDRQIRVLKPDTVVKNLKLNTQPVKFTKMPTLIPGLYKSVSGLKKEDLSDTRDSSDRTQIESTGSNATNSIDITESATTKVDNCYVTPKTLDITTADFSYFTESSTPDFIKPGVVINYQSILDGRNTINTAPRKPMKIYLVNTSAIPGLDNLLVNIEEPQNISGINNALGSLTGRLNTKSVPANMSFEIMEITSEKQLQYAVTGSYSYGSMLSAKFGVSGGNYSNSYYYLLKFRT